MYEMKIFAKNLFEIVKMRNLQVENFKFSNTQVRFT